MDYHNLSEDDKTRLRVKRIFHRIEQQFQHAQRYSFTFGKQCLNETARKDLNEWERFNRRAALIRWSILNRTRFFLPKNVRENPFEPNS